MFGCRAKKILLSLPNTSLYQSQLRHNTGKVQPINRLNAKFARIPNSHFKWREISNSERSVPKSHLKWGCLCGSHLHRKALCFCSFLAQVPLRIPSEAATVLISEYDAFSCLSSVRRKDWGQKPQPKADTMPSAGVCYLLRVVGGPKAGNDLVHFSGKKYFQSSLSFLGEVK